MLLAIFNPFLDFYPEDFLGCNQYKLFQSNKWLYLSQSMQTQMCINTTKNFYIFEPVQTTSMQIFVPIFFFRLNSDLYVKCITPTVKKVDAERFQLSIPAQMPFNNSSLQNILVSEFNFEYSNITLGNQILSKLCGAKIFEENKTNDLQK